MKRKKPKLNFPSVPISEAALHRGKHAKTIASVLSDLAALDEYSAIKIDLAQIGQKKADLRAALHRAAKKKEINLVTTSDETHLYVFRVTAKSK